MKARNSHLKYREEFHAGKSKDLRHKLLSWIISSEIHNEKNDGLENTSLGRQTEYEKTKKETEEKRRWS